MGTTVKSFFQSFSEISEGKFPPEYYTPRLLRTMVFGNYAHSLGILTHSLFIVIFALIGVRTLALFNIFSVMLWATAFILHRRGYISQGYLLITIENIAHAAVCTVVIGWDTGFQYIILVQPACVFVLHWSTTKKALIASIYCLAYIAMNYYANISVPIIELSQIYITALNYGNIIVICLILTSFGYIYSRAALTAEEKLEQEHQKTNAALIERNQALKLLNQELAEAADYVRTILPEPITEGPIRTDWRFVPSTSLGGDAFGYHMVDDDHFAIYLIDVSGHGVGAALLSVSVMNVLRSQSLPNTDFKDPEQVLEALNIAFPGEENNDMFFTMWYGVYKKSTRQLTYASGGHPPAILLDQTSKGDYQATQLRTPNYVIGGMSEAKGTYQKKECRVGERNTLYIFSDGVYEVEKSDGTMWRFQEFADFLNNVKTDGQSILDRLYNYSKKLGNSENFEDDFTIVEVAFG
ncbi:MAG: PP2C family protein-serine/threonine phosphatase [Desulfobacterales bacterium]|jgi:sigma-B regulation protein RsbU (phosphoserine phosphatase)|nr:PP2C family protein-serine/threonine phosphatase [Desulfobacteraceae bacterium]MDH3826109.1 PP2C family protein-serine/threonine phosphatase [Desulfobacterales bacterium]